MRALIGLTAALSLFGAQAQAQTAETKADIRCIATLASVGAEDPDAMPAVTIAVMFFMGRIDGRQPNLDLTAALAVEAASLEGQDLQREAERCGRIIVEKGEALKRIGAQLQALPAPKE